MSDWGNFFLGELDASAALAGLIFVGISINICKIMESSFLPNRALEALVMLVSVLLLSSLFLIPHQSLFVMGLEALLLGLCEFIILLYLQIDSLRKMQSQYHWKFIRFMLICQIAVLSFIIAGIIFLVGGTMGFYCATVSCHASDRNVNNILIEFPRVVIEVLSPSTEAKDRGVKFSTYQACPLIQEIVLVSQFSQHVEVWLRNEREPDNPKAWLYRLYGSGDVIHLSSVSVSIPIELFYRGLSFDEGEEEL